MNVYDSKDMWNFEEIGIRYKNPPSKSDVTIYDDFKGSKQQKKCIFCHSLLGEKYYWQIQIACVKKFDIKDFNVRYS